jgi:hypothetical protein
MRTLAALLALLLLATANAAGADVLCVLKQFNGTVRVQSADGTTANAERGPLYEGQVLLLDKGAEVTLVIGKRSVDLPGPLQLPIQQEVLAEAQDGGSKGLLERLAALLPGLSDGGAYSSGAVRGEGDEGVPFRLLGPQGKVIGHFWWFRPLGGQHKCELHIMQNGDMLFALSVTTEKPFYIAGLAPGSYSYEYRSDDPLTQGGWPPVEFHTAAADEQAAMYSRLSQFSQDVSLAEALSVAVDLANAGFVYDAWSLCDSTLENPATDPTIPEAALLASLRDRLGGTLLK